MRRLKGLLGWLLVLLLAFWAVACSNASGEKPQDIANDSDASQDTESEDAGKAVQGTIPDSESQDTDVGDAVAFPFKFTDFVGREVTVEKEPQRIVSLAPSITELIYALGAGDRVVGVTTFDNYPPEVQDVPKVGDFNGPNVEAIIAQKPDIIFASSLSGKDQMESLQQSTGIPVAVLEARNIKQIYESIQLIGKLTGKQEKGQEVIREMQNKIDEISGKTKDLPKVKVFYLLDINGNWTAGKGSFIDELIALAGGENIAADADGEWIQYSTEELVKKNPDIIIMGASYADKVKDIKNMVGYRDTNAVKNDKVFVLSNDDLISRPSNRIILVLEEIARILHPEVFE
ncbi:ABC transporter substrate-binding protein [Caldicoprobacter faecalis]|uniref:Iron complex transport system substrate-binding protein n=1 Tax=Caldicoprobacter faecalis TaxID=937334 RepID=A0A1I5VQV4_9FIRM|nr:ABC transporter substrate-binding protein [Caldicoprobacter faecalis]PZN10722.1 MAG: ABC transporter substrate-binding protein [Caldicoprobacter oshimai]SFQ09386.1 iron complex transport system substrate-binding protein [Caldicoprobacter faecalis]